MGEGACRCTATSGEVTERGVVRRAILDTDCTTHVFDGAVLLLRERITIAQWDGVQIDDVHPQWCIVHGHTPHTCIEREIRLGDEEGCAMLTWLCVECARPTTQALAAMYPSTGPDEAHE